MQLIIKNQTASPLSYVQGQVTCQANSNVAVPRDYNTLLLSDANFLNDATSGNIVLNNGYSDLTGPSIIILAQSFAQFTTSAIATLPLYYSLPVAIRQSANTGSGATVWSMRNDASSLKQVVIERINLIMSFDSGTPLGRSMLKYDICRFSAATPSGGSLITPVLNDSLSPATVVTDARTLDTGLTTTGISFENPFATVICPASDGAVTKFLRNTMAFKLAAGEGLAIRLSANAVTGQDLGGEITWSER